MGFGNAALSFVFYSLGPILKRLGVLQGGDPIVGAVITQVTGLMFIGLLGKTVRIRIVWRGVPLAGAVCFAVSGVVHAIGTILTFLAVVHAPAVIVGPIWNIQPLVTFALAHFTLKGIEIVRIQGRRGRGPDRGRSVPAGVDVKSVLRLRSPFNRLRTRYACPEPRRRAQDERRKIGQGRSVLPMR